MTTIIEARKLARGRSAKHPNLVASGGSANRTFCERLERLRRELVNMRDATHRRAEQRSETRMSRHDSVPR